MLWESTDVPTQGTGERWAEEALLQPCPPVGLCPSVTVEQTKVLGGRAVLMGDTFSCGCGPCGCAPVPGKCHHGYLNRLGKGAAMSLVGRRQVQEGEMQNAVWGGQRCRKDLCIQGMSGPT